MKKLTFLFALVLPLAAFAQGGNTGMGVERTEFESLAQRLLELEKKSNAFNVYMNFAGSYSSDNGNELAAGGWNSAFKAREIRLEIKGNLTDAIYYRFRQKMNHSNKAGSLDNFSPATDIMMVGLRLGEHFAVEGGKICQHWGGFDYDENPMYVYQYSDLINRMDIFFGGVDFCWRPNPSQEFVLEVTNPLNSSFEDTYGPEVYLSGSNPGEFSRVYGARHPLNLLLNWNGNFFDGALLTRCAVGGMSQTDEIFSRLLNGGVKFNSRHLQCYVDYMLEKDGMDRIGIATHDFAPGAGKRFRDVLYTSLIGKLFWQFAPGWNLVAKGSYDTVESPLLGKYRKSLMGMCSLEYYPDFSQDFRVFLAGTCHNVAFSGESALQPFNTARVELGIMYRIKCY